MPEGELMGSEEQPRESTLHAALWPPLCARLASCPEPEIPTRLDMLVRPLELDRVPAALSVEGGDAAVGAVELCPRLHRVNANALTCSERLPGCR